MLFIMTLFSHSLFVESKRKILVVSSLFSCPVIDLAGKLSHHAFEPCRPPFLDSSLMLNVCNIQIYVHNAYMYANKKRKSVNIIGTSSGVSLSIHSIQSLRKNITHIEKLFVLCPAVSLYSYCISSFHRIKNRRRWILQCWSYDLCIIALVRHATVLPREPTPLPLQPPAAKKNIAMDRYKK